MRGEAEVRAFTGMMLQKLYENEYKGALVGLDVDRLRGDLEDEVLELDEAVSKLEGIVLPSVVDKQRMIRDVGREAADVANVAMLVALNCGAIDYEEGE